MSTGSRNDADVERHNRSMRMGMRRLTRLTNAFSKRHKTLRVTPVDGGEDRDGDAGRRMDRQPDRRTSTKAEPPKDLQAAEAGFR